MRRSRLAVSTAVLGAALAAAACGGRKNDARDPATGQPLGNDTLAAKSPLSSDTAAANHLTGPQGDSSAKAHGGTGPTGMQQGGPTGASAAGTSAASGDSTGKH